ncbi:hypothetical protein QJQ45_018395, partial [Haematococcus lacustris]
AGRTRRCSTCPAGGFQSTGLVALRLTRCLSQGCWPFTAELTRLVRCSTTSTTLPRHWSVPLGLHTTLQQARNTASAPHPPLLPMPAAPKNTTSCLARPCRLMDTAAMSSSSCSHAHKAHMWYLKYQPANLKSDKEMFLTYIAPIHYNAIRIEGACMQESLLSQKHLCQTGQQPPQRLTPARVAKAADAPAGTPLERLGGAVAGPADSPSVADSSSGALKSSASQRAAALKALKAQRHTPALSHTSKNSDAEVASEQSSCNGRTAATSMPQQELTSSNHLTENDTRQPNRSSLSTLASQLPLATDMAHVDSCSHSRQTIPATAVVADLLSSDADGCQGCQILTPKAPTDQGKSHQPDHSMHYHDPQAAAAELTKAQAALEQQSQDVLQAKAVNLQLQQELQDSNQKAAQAVAALDELQGAYSMLLKQHAVLSLEAQEQQAELSDQLAQAKALQAAAQHRAEAAQVLMESQATSEFAAMEAMQMQLTALSAEKQSLATQLAKAQRDVATVYAKKLEREAALAALKKKCGNLAASVVAQQSEAATLEARLASARQRVHSLEKAVEKERAARERAEREVTMLKEEVSVMVAIINGNATLVQALEEEVAHRQLAVKGWSEAPHSPARRRTVQEELSTPARSRPVMAPGDCELTPMSIPLRQAAAAAAAAMTAVPRATSAESRAHLSTHQPPASPAQRQLHR